jgi:heme exporter protein C
VRRAEVALWAALFGSMSLALAMAFLYAPTERVMGPVQRIFYVHVGLWWAALLSFFLTFVAGIQTLRTRADAWDELGGASAEVGVLLNGLVLLTGAIWARPTWGVWWTWEPQLTATLLTELVYLGLLVLRSATEGERARTFCAVVGILAFLNLPVVFFSARLLRGVHPVVFGQDPAGRPTGLDPAMLHTLLVWLLACTVLCGVLVQLRAQLGLLDRRVRRLRAARGA